MGNSQSGHEENYTEIQKLKDILAANTETFTYNKKGGDNTEQNYTEIQQIRDLLAADTETFSLYQVGSAKDAGGGGGGSGRSSPTLQSAPGSGRSSPTFQSGPVSSIFKIDYKSRVLCISGENKGIYGIITNVLGNGSNKEYTVTLDNKKKIKISRADLYTIFQLDPAIIKINQQEADQKAAEKAKRTAEWYRQEELGKISAAEEKLRRKQMEEEAAAERYKKEEAQRQRVQALALSNLYNPSPQQQEEEDDGAGGGSGEDANQRREAIRHARQEKERIEREEAREEEKQRNKKDRAEELAELARLKKGEKE